MTLDELDRRLRAIVAGQVRSHMNDHPEMYPRWVLNSRHRDNFANGIAKRAVPDILAMELNCGLIDDGVAGTTAPSPQDPAGVGSNCAGRARDSQLRAEGAQGAARASGRHCTTGETPTHDPHTNLDPNNCGAAAPDGGPVLSDRA